MSEKIENIEKIYKAVKEMFKKRLVEAMSNSEDWKYQSGYEDGMHDAMLILLAELRKVSDAE